MKCLLYILPFFFMQSDFPEYTGSARVPVAQCNDILVHCPQNPPPLGIFSCQDKSRRDSRRADVLRMLLSGAPFVLYFSVGAWLVTHEVLVDNTACPWPFTMSSKFCL
ncbi:hypothetical protein R3P38DRAFT_1700009 [Favolaschia claudopus]|uniref:Uncharacterized protein n=1 Tax=Favolaschia claudopus TaxID=2862362 RepID=A0AAW0ACE7_9AGAR